MRAATNATAPRASKALRRQRRGQKLATGRKGANFTPCDIPRLRPDNAGIRFECPWSKALYL